MNEATPVAAAAEGVATSAFIPVSRSDVLEALLVPQYWRDDAERVLAREVFLKIGTLRQHKSALMLNELSDVYDPFNPDDETINQGELSPEEKREQLTVFNDRLHTLIGSANYVELTDEAIEIVLSNHSPDGVHVEVDFSEYELRQLFCRGEAIQARSKRDIWWAYLRRKQYTVPTYRRVVMALKFKPDEVRVSELMHLHGITEEKARKKLRKLRQNLPPSCSTSHIYLKIFKDIPRHDIEMFFPNIRVKIKNSDKMQIGGSAVFGAVSYTVGTAIKLVTVAVLSPMVLAGALAMGFGGIIYAQVRNIFIARDRYRMQLAQSLYFQNLANNQAALAMVVDEAEEEDVKEEILLYAHLLGGPFHVSQLELLRGYINKFLADNLGAVVNFDIEDALARLLDLGIVTQTASGDLVALPLASARDVLHQRWCTLDS
jgi:hypothetical protein